MSFSQMTMVLLFGAHCIRSMQCSEVILPFLKKGYQNHKPQACFQFSLLLKSCLLPFKIIICMINKTSCTSILFPNEGEGSYGLLVHCGESGPLIIVCVFSKLNVRVQQCKCVCKFPDTLVRICAHIQF